MANNFKVFTTSLADTNLTTLITASNTSLFIIGSIIICNTHAATTSTIDVVITDTSAAASVKIASDQSFAANVRLELLTRPIVLENLDILKAQAADANIFDITVSYLDRDRT